MSKNISTYTAYFRKLATEHYLIRHDPQQEGPDAKSKAKCRFVLFDTDEVIVGLRSLIGDGVVMFLETYTFNGNDNGAGDFRSAHQGRFIIAEKSTAMDTVSTEAALKKCEGIVWDIIGKIHTQSNDPFNPCGTPFSNVVTSDFSAEPVTKLWTNYSGWVVNFNFRWNRIDVVSATRANDPAVWVPFVPQPAPAPAPAPINWDTI